jgi:transcriptional regulator of acetoin/glycerol metabolism
VTDFRSPRQAPVQAQALPPQAFFAEAPQRTALARERFFAEGQRPTGLVSEAVIQSWQRCLQARRQPPERLGFDPVTASRQHRALQRGRPLLEAASPVLQRLEAALAATGARALLCDGDGVVVHRTPAAGGPEPVLALAARVGVDLSEAVVGTTAPGIVLRSGRACTVTAGEHYFDQCGALSCAAAPIRDRGGQLAGVLDLSVEGRPFGFDAAALVGLYAGAIENALLEGVDGDCLLLRFQADPVLLGTPLQALAGVNGRGELAWINQVGCSLLGAGVRPGRPVDEVFGCDLAALLAASGTPTPRMLRLANGLVVWLVARLQMQPGAAAAKPASPAPQPVAETPPKSADPEAPSTLAQHDQKLVLDTLARCGGNVSRAARELGVSRGLLYRRLAAMR